MAKVRHWWKIGLVMGALLLIILLIATYNITQKLEQLPSESGYESMLAPYPPSLRFCIEVFIFGFLIGAALTAAIEFMIGKIRDKKGNQ